MLLNVGSSSAISTTLRTIVHGHAGDRSLGSSVRRVLRRVGSRSRHRGTTLRVASVVFAATILAGGGLRAVGDYLHAAGNRAGWRAASGSVGRSLGSAESLV